MASFQISGKLVKKYDTESKSASFQARDFVIVTEDQFPQYIKFQLVQDRCAILDPFREEEKITVHFDIRGKEWQGKYLTNLNAWKIDGQKEQVPAGQTVVNSAGPDPFAQAPALDDLPF
ncbi:MAG TPA: DUF3127 domain-containing protein [Saprospiraceae bacterium]|nr:DUF3127 domain-containing protein [Saprospiraceae bacterium]